MKKVPLKSTSSSGSTKSTIIDPCLLDNIVLRVGNVPEFNPRLPMFDLSREGIDRCVWPRHLPCSSSQVDSLKKLIDSLVNDATRENPSSLYNKASYFKMPREVQEEYLKRGFRPLNPNWVVFKPDNPDMQSHPDFPPVLPGMKASSYKILCNEWCKKNKVICMSMVKALNKKTLDGLETITKMPQTIHINGDEMKTLLGVSSLELASMLGTQNKKRFYTHFHYYNLDDLKDKSEAEQNLDQDNPNKFILPKYCHTVYSDEYKEHIHAMTFISQLTPHQELEAYILMGENRYNFKSKPVTVQEENELENPNLALLKKNEALDQKLKEMLVTMGPNAKTALFGEPMTKEEQSITFEMLQKNFGGLSFVPGATEGVVLEDFDEEANSSKVPQPTGSDNPFSRDINSIPGVKSIETKMYLNPEVVPPALSRSNSQSSYKSLREQVTDMENDSILNEKVFQLNLELRAVTEDLALISSFTSSDLTVVLSNIHIHKSAIIKELGLINDNLRAFLNETEMGKPDFDVLLSYIKSHTDSVCKALGNEFSQIVLEIVSDLETQCIPLFISFFNPFYFHKIIPFKAVIREYKNLNLKFLYSNVSALMQVSRNVLLKTDAYGTGMHSVLSNIFSLTATAAVNNSDTSKLLKSVLAKLELSEVEKSLRGDNQNTCKPQVKPVEIPQEPKDKLLLKLLTTEFWIIGNYSIPVDSSGGVDKVVAEEMITRMKDDLRIIVFTELINFEFSTVMSLASLSNPMKVTECLGSSFVKRGGKIQLMEHLVKSNIQKLVNEPKTAITKKGFLDVKPKLIQMGIIPKED